MAARHSLAKIQIFPNNKAIFHFLLLTLPTAQLCRLHKEYGLNAGISGVMGKRYRNGAGLLARCEPYTPTHNSNDNNAHVALTPTYNQGLALACNEAKAIY